jgi:hypothetical protein
MTRKTLNRTALAFVMAGSLALGTAFIPAYAAEPDYPPGANPCNGEIKGVQLSIVDDPNNSDHLVKPEDAIPAAMGRQWRS